MNEILQILSKAPSEAWVGLLGVVIGAALSIFGVWLTNRSSIKQLNIQLEHEKITNADVLKREKLEELYILIDKWLSGIFSHYLNLTLVMRGEIDFNQYLDQVVEVGKKNTVDFSRLEMIVDIYGHKLQPSRLKEEKAKVLEIVRKMQLESVLSGAKGPWLPDIKGIDKRRPK